MTVPVTLVDTYDIVLVDTSGGGFTLVLPPVATCTQRVMAIKCVSNPFGTGSGLSTQGADTFEDGLTIEDLSVLDGLVTWLLFPNKGTNVWQFLSRETAP